MFENRLILIYRRVPPKSDIMVTNCLFEVRGLEPPNIVTNVRYPIPFRDYLSRH